MSAEKSNLEGAGQPSAFVSDIIIDIDNDKIIYDDPYAGPGGATWQVHESKDKRIYYIVYWYPEDKNLIKIIFVESKREG